MWDVLFMSAFRLRPSETVSVLEAMVHVLPCVHCRRSYAHYVERNPPRACARTEEDIAKWLWAVHDLVNIKLDKRATCIPFSVVQTRHAVFTNWCSPFDPIDLLALISLQVETAAQAHAYAALVPCFQKISRLCGAPPVSVADPPSHAKDLWRHAFSLCSGTRRALGLAACTETEFLAQYELCRAHDDPPPAKTAPVQGATMRRLRAQRARGMR